MVNVRVRSRVWPNRMYAWREQKTSILGSTGQGGKTKHEQLFVLMGANARTGRRGNGRPGNEHCGALGAYGRDTQNDNSEHLLVFASNHDLALVNTFSGTPKTASRIPSTGRGIGTHRLHPHENIVVHPQPFSLPISDHNAVVAHVRLLDRFARNRPIRRDTKPPSTSVIDGGAATPGSSGDSDHSPSPSSTLEGYQC